jgi:nucleoside triphosphate pyrophosphatase
MALWLADAPLVLASRSEIRRKILSAAGLPLEVAPADIDERALEARAPGADPAAVAALLAREKALAAARARPGRLVLGADQTLALGPRLLSKPADVTAARAQLAALRGQTHALHAAIALARDDAVTFEHRDLARLTMRDFSDAFLDAYIGAAGAAVTASVGAYQLEGAGIHLFERVEGDYFTILGLPLLPLLRHLRQARFLAA